MASPLVQLGHCEGLRGGPTSESARWDCPPGVRGTQPPVGPERPAAPLGTCAAAPHSQVRRSPQPAPGTGPSASAASGPKEFSSGSSGSGRGRPARVPAPSRKLAPAEPAARGPAARTPHGGPRAPSSAAERPRTGRHSPQRLDRTCPVSLPSPGARAASRARLPAPPPPLSARRHGESQQVTRHLAKNTGSLRWAPASARTLRPPALQPASQPASNGISSFSLHYCVRWES